MKHFNFFLLLLFPLLLACSHREYDISEGFSKEVTLFENEITVPVGSIGPLRLGSVLDKLFQMEGVGSLLADFLKEGEDGYMNMFYSGNIFKLNVYEMEKELEDVSSPSSYTSSYESGYVGGLAGTVGYLGLRAMDQKVSFKATNPLRDPVQVSCTPSYNCIGPDAMVVAPIDGLDNFSLDYCGTTRVLEFSLPNDVITPLTFLSLYNLQLSLPARPTSRIMDRTGNVFFSMDFDYTGKLAVSEAFKFQLHDLSPGDVKLEIGKFNLSFCQVSLDLENSIPLQVGIDNVRMLKEDGKTVDENIQITSGIVIAGGTLEHPATTRIILSVEALEGTIPDIHGIMLDIDLAGQPGLEKPVVSTSQGVYVKSSSATLYGGITIPLNK